MCGRIFNIVRVDTYYNRTSVRYRSQIGQIFKLVDLAKTSNVTKLSCGMVLR